MFLQEAIKYEFILDLCATKRPYKDTFISSQMNSSVQGPLTFREMSHIVI